MQHWFGAAVLTLTCASAGLAQGTGARDTPAPDFHAFTLGEHPTPRTLADYRGDVVILALWATWCRDCRDEMASLQRLHATYVKQGLRVVAVSVDRGGEGRIREFVRELGLTFDVLRDESGKILATYGTPGVPTTFLIGRDGVIRRRVLSGVDWDVGPRLEQIKALLAEPAPAERTSGRTGS